MTPAVPVAAVDALRIAHLRAIDDLLVGMRSGPKREELALLRGRLMGQ